jgi:DNA-binding protein HU-beta
LEGSGVGDFFDEAYFSAKMEKAALHNHLSKIGGRAMNKAELAKEVANQTGLTKRTSREAVDTITSVITDVLAREEKVTLVGFGTFQVMERRARTGVNPQTRKRLDIPAKKVVRFKAGKGLREKAGK